jgi:hypothetical protein
LLASTALPHFAPLGRVTTRLKLIQILRLVPWQVWLCHSRSALPLWPRQNSARLARASTTFQSFSVGHFKQHLE